MSEMKYYLESLVVEETREKEKGIKGERKKGGSKYIGAADTACEGDLVREIGKLLRRPVEKIFAHDFCRAAPISLFPVFSPLPSPFPILRLLRRINLGAPNGRFL